MILVMSGTEEGRVIVKELNERGRGVLTTVATEYGHEIFEKMGLGDICLLGRLDIDGLSALIAEKDINTLIDATHPYATQVSLNAIEACEKSSIKYIRFQRSETDINGEDYVHVVGSIDEAVEWCRNSDKRCILLTTGITSVEKFAELIDVKEIIVRILPVPRHIEECVKLGIKSSNILALQGPFTLEFNKAVIDQYKIDVMITKDSGKAGGVPEKIQAAKETGTEVVLIKRQEIQYPIKCSTVEEVYDMLA